MPRYFTHYRSKETFNGYKSAQLQEPIDFIASNRFRQRGIVSGDEVFVVSIFSEKIWLAGKLGVLGVCDCEEAAALVNWSSDDMWDAEDYIVASQATSQNYQLSVPPDMAEQLRFISPKGEKSPLKFVGPSRPDTQTLRGVRELTPESALLLSSILPPMNPIIDLNTEDIRMKGAEKWSRRNAHIDQSDLRCSLCSTNFQDAYGMLGLGFLHSHFRKQEMRSKSNNNAVEKRSPFICFNCQFMLDCVKPPITADQLSRLLLRKVPDDVMT